MQLRKRTTKITYSISFNTEEVEAILGPGVAHANADRIIPRKLARIMDDNGCLEGKYAIIYMCSTFDSSDETHLKDILFFLIVEASISTTKIRQYISSLLKPVSV